MYASIGFFDSSKGQLGVAPRDRQSLIELGKAWILDKESALRTLICNDVNIQEQVFLNQFNKDKVEAILLIADLIVSICGGVPAIYVATLLIKIGLKDWCNGSMGT